MSTDEFQSTELGHLLVTQTLISSLTTPILTWIIFISVVKTEDEKQTVERILAANNKNSDSTWFKHMEH